MKSTDSFVVKKRENFNENGRHTLISNNKQNHGYKRLSTRTPTPVGEVHNPHYATGGEREIRNRDAIVTTIRTGYQNYLRLEVTPMIKRGRQTLPLAQNRLGDYKTIPYTRRTDIAVLSILFPFAQRDIRCISEQLARCSYFTRRLFFVVFSVIGSTIEFSLSSENMEYVPTSVPATVAKMYVLTTAYAL